MIAFSAGGCRYVRIQDLTPVPLALDDPDLVREVSADAEAFAKGVKSCIRA
jgi:hypothetical protein